MKPNEYKSDGRKWDDLTPEEQDQVSEIVKQWIEGNVEFKVDPEGRVLMRLKDAGTPERSQ